MSELSNAVTPTFNRVIKQVIEQEDQAIPIANAHMHSKPDLNKADLSSPTLIELNPDSFDGVVLYSGQHGETAVIVQNGKVIWTGLSYDKVSNIGNAALRQTDRADRYGTRPPTPTPQIRQTDIADIG